MSKIRSKNTKPELVVRHHLHMLGFRYRLHSPKLPGHPDIVLPKWHTVIFINGCFWHRHEGCKVATMHHHIGFWQVCQLPMTIVCVGDLENFHNVNNVWLTIFFLRSSLKSSESSVWSLSL